VLFVEVDLEGRAIQTKQHRLRCRRPVQIIHPLLDHFPGHAGMACASR
jgi:hypothetical protein